MKGLAVLYVAIIMMVRPLWPVFEYIVNYDYIVNVLCENRDVPELNCDGKCYLAEQLSRESERNQKNPFGENQLIEMPQILDTFTDVSLDKHQYLYNSSRTVIWPKPNFHTLLFVFEKIQPPEI